MKAFKRILAVVMAIAMILPMCIITSFATADAAIDENWTVFAGKFQSGNFSSQKDKGFNFTTTADGGIAVDIPNGSKREYGTTVAQRAASVPVSALTSKTKVPLGGLSVTYLLNDSFNFAVSGSPTLNLLWTTDPIYTMNDAVNTDCGAKHRDGFTSNGFRPLAKDGTKGLLISVKNSYAVYDQTKTVSDVTIVYFDGSFKDGTDRANGYRWTFTARNNPQTVNADSSGITRPYENIDCSNGLTLSVREDATYGFVAQVNGVDYYLGSEVGYFPNDTGSLTDTDYETNSEKYKNSMTYKRADIDLSALVGQEGYLTIGSSGDTKATDLNEYTVANVNGLSSATWSGQSSSEHTHTPYNLDERWISCTDPSYATTKCSSCGAILGVTTIPAAGHKYEVTSETFANCTDDGVRHEICAVCNQERDIVTKRAGHSWSNYTIVSKPTDEADGMRTRVCSTCNTVENQVLPKNGSDYSSFWTVSAYNQVVQSDKLPEDTQIVYPSVSENGSLVLNDYGRQNDNDKSQYTLTKAVSKFATYLDNFEATITPLAFNSEKADVFPETFAFIWTTEPVDYDDANEYGVLENLKPNNIDAMRFGFAWDHGYCRSECSLIITLMDYFITHESYGDIVRGTQGDGIYDIAVYAIIGSGNVWTSKYNDGIRLNPANKFTVKVIPSVLASGTMYSIGFTSYDESGAEVYNYDVAMPESLGSQKSDELYHFGIAAYSDGSGIRGSSFEINSVCGDEGAHFDAVENSSDVPHVHEPEEKITEATCTEPGTKQIVCKTCGEIISEETIPAKGHTEGEAVVVPATCTEDGSETVSCTVCHEVISTKVIPAKGHTEGEAVIEKDPTCTEEGLEVVYCTECGAKLSEKALPENGHTPGNVEVEKEATCTEAGVKVTYCKDCNAKIGEEVIPAKGHTEGEAVVVPATCTEDGSETVSCTVCHEVISTKVLPAKGHTEGEHKIVKEATCTEAAIEAVLCKDCGAEIERKTVGEALGHNPGEPKVITAATCTKDGSAEIRCTRCNTLIDTVTLPATGHKDGERVVIQSQSCTNDEITSVKCAVCGEEIRQETTALALGHTEGEPEIVKPATCTEDGSSVVKCLRCGEVIRENVITKLGHDFGEWYVKVPATVTEKGVEQRDCSRCDAFDTRDIPKLECEPSEISIDKWVVSATNAAEISEIRYAFGEYATSDELAAADCVTITDLSKAVDGVFKFELETAGRYTVCAIMADGSEYVKVVEAAQMSATISANIVNITLHNLYGVSDYFIAKIPEEDIANNVDTDVYRYVKDNLVVRVTPLKFKADGFTKDYTYNVREVGEYVVCVRYFDGRMEFLHVECTGASPKVNLDGQRLTVSDLEGVKVVRIAYGTFDDVQVLKNSDDVIAMPAKNKIEEAGGIVSVKLRKTGDVTVIVQYDNGVVAIEHLNVNF